jgi:hypothetical protein
VLDESTVREWLQSGTIAYASAKYQNKGTTDLDRAIGPSLNFTMGIDQGLNGSSIDVGAAL